MVGISKQRRILYSRTWISIEHNIIKTISLPLLLLLGPTTTRSTTTNISLCGSARNHCSNLLVSEPLRSAPLYSAPLGSMHGNARVRISIIHWHSGTVAEYVVSAHVIEHQTAPAI